MDRRLVNLRAGEAHAQVVGNNHKVFFENPAFMDKFEELKQFEEHQVDVGQVLTRQKVVLLQVLRQ